MTKTLPEPTITELTGVTLPCKDVSLGERITAGSYVATNPYITAERFPITLDAGPCDLALAYFGVDTDHREVDDWMEVHPEYVNALIEEALAVGSHPQYKELQRQFNIVARGSSTVLDDHPCVPVLHQYYPGRGLGLDSPYAWERGCRFLLRKVKKPSGS